MRIARHVPLVLVTAAVAVAAGAALVAKSSTRDPITQPVTLRFKAESVTLREVDVDPAGFSIGDQQIKTSRLLTKGEEVGRLASVCTATGTRPNQVLCTATFKVPQGQIAIQELYRRSVFLAGKSTNVAVVGGTGSYQNVRGQGTQTRVDKITVRYVLNLMP